jgi:hypothetical protein
LLEAFTAAHNVKVLVSGYQSINMHCIVLPVIFDGGLSITFMRNRQLLTKKRGKKDGPEFCVQQEFVVRGEVGGG